MHNKRNLRMAIEGILYRTRVGCPWRDLPQAIGKSRVGNTTKIYLTVDGYGLPVEYEITGGEVNDCSAAPDLITRLPEAEAIVADKGYDSDYIREQITKKEARPLIPRKSNSLKGNADMDCIGIWWKTLLRD